MGSASCDGPTDAGADVAAVSAGDVPVVDGLRVFGESGVGEDAAVLVRGHDVARLPAPVGHEVSAVRGSDDATVGVSPKIPCGEVDGGKGRLAMLRGHEDHQAVRALLLHGKESITDGPVKAGGPIVKLHQAGEGDRM
jgi:hypothetical protein